MQQQPQQNIQFSSLLVRRQRNPFYLLSIIPIAISQIVCCSVSYNKLGRKSHCHGRL
jgi:hypothetical protein